MVISSIQSRREQGLPLNYQAVVRDDEKLTGAARRLFGSWNNALTAAGIDPASVKHPRANKRPPGYWSCERVATELRQLHEQGIDLNAHNVQRIRPDLEAAAKTYYGSYQAAIEAIGLDYSTIRKTDEWTPERVLSILQSAHKANADLSDNTIAALNPALYSAIYTHFGNLSNALIAAGIDPDTTRRTTAWSRDKLIQYCRDVMDAGIRLRSLAKIDSRIIHAAQDHFGSVSALWDALGLPPEPDEPPTSGERIRQRREELGLSKSELGRRVGVSHTAIRLFEQGQFTIRIDMAIKLARALDTTVEALFGE
jgi:putative transcriptional regulator